MKSTFLILKFIQKHNLNGTTFLKKDFPLDELKITSSQLDLYLKNLADSGYIKGIFKISLYGGKIGIKLNNPTITTKGMEYLENNSSMKKLFNFYKENKDTIPFFLKCFF
ncbi:YjcQ family protein [Cetobacterium sp.]|uniref:YjcQ family protein n=1 Tax=Cetobacterium sp. TaxID=2071632 RepID=UPI003EE6C912